MLDEGPAIVYNVPGRTGQDIPDEVVCQLAAHPSFLGVKECTGNARIQVRAPAALPRPCMHGGAPFWAHSNVALCCAPCAVHSRLAACQGAAVRCAAHGCRVTSGCSVSERQCVLTGRGFGLMQEPSKTEL